MTSDTVTGPVPAAEPIPRRSFGVFDAMILIAGLALAISGGLRLFANLSEFFIYLCRTIAAYDSALYSKHPERRRFLIWEHWTMVLFYGFQLLEVLIVSMAPAFLLIRLRQPRPSLRALLRQAGTVACLAVMFGGIWVSGWLHRLFFGRISLQTGTAIAAGGTVAVAWAFLALSRKWQTEPSWVDRMGRLIGVMAIAVRLLAFMKFGI